MSLDTRDSGGVRLIRFGPTPSSPLLSVLPLHRVEQHFCGTTTSTCATSASRTRSAGDVDRLRLEQAALLEDARQGQRLQALLNFQEKYLYKT